MTEANSDYADYLRYCASIREAYVDDKKTHHQMANDTTRLMLNVLFVLNAGGIVALPAFKALIPKASETIGTLALPGALFVAGLVLALVSGAFAIANFRLIGHSMDLQMTAELRRAGDMYPPDPNRPLSSEVEKLLARADSFGTRSIWWTFNISWISGVLSGVVFVFAASSIGGATNPLCGLLGRVGMCPTL